MSEDCLSNCRGGTLATRSARNRIAFAMQGGKCTARSRRPLRLDRGSPWTRRRNTRIHSIGSERVELEDELQCKPYGTRRLVKRPLGYLVGTTCSAC